MKSVLVFAALAVAATTAHAAKCTGTADCAYRAYTTKNEKGERVVDLYGSQCSYADSDGYQGQFPASALTRGGDGKFVLDTGATKIVLECK